MTSGSEELIGLRDDGILAANARGPPVGRGLGRMISPAVESSLARGARDGGANPIACHGEP